MEIENSDDPGIGNDSYDPCTDFEQRAMQIEPAML
jgi:hypothetical protein